MLLEKNSYLLTIMNEEKINYYTLLNYGNHGYHGTTMMLNKIKQEKNRYFVIEKKHVVHPYNQFMFELTDYVRENCKLKRSIGEFEIYYKD